MYFIIKLIAKKFNIFIQVTFIYIPEKREYWQNIAVKNGLSVYMNLSNELDMLNPVWTVKARSSFLPNEYDNFTDSDVFFTIVRIRDGNIVGRFREPWTVPIAPPALAQQIPMKQVEHAFILPGVMGGNDAHVSEDAEFSSGIFDGESLYRLEVTTNEQEPISLSVTIATFNELSLKGIIMAGGVLIFLYVLIIFEVVHRTLASMIGAVAAIACLTVTRDVSVNNCCLVYLHRVEVRRCQTFPLVLKQSLCIQKLGLLTFSSPLMLFVYSDLHSSESSRGLTLKLWHCCLA